MLCCIYIYIYEIFSNLFITEQEDDLTEIVRRQDQYHERLIQEEGNPVCVQYLLYNHDFNIILMLYTCNSISI